METREVRCGLAENQDDLHGARREELQGLVSIDQLQKDTARVDSGNSVDSCQVI